MKLSIGTLQSDTFNFPRYTTFLANTPTRIEPLTLLRDLIRLK